MIELEELRIDPREVQAYVDGESAGADRVQAALPLALEPGGSRRATSCCRRSGAARRCRDRTVDVFVGRLQDKIDKRASRHTFVQTRYGVGYKLEAVPK